MNIEHTSIFILFRMRGEKGNLEKGRAEGEKKVREDIRFRHSFPPFTIEGERNKKKGK